MGLFDDPYRYLDAARAEKWVRHPDHLTLARVAAARSAVLLKNENSVLPFGPEVKKLAVMGELAHDSRTLLGAWNTAGKKEETESLMEGLQQALPEVDVVYTEEVQMANLADAVLLVLGEHWDLSGESRNRTTITLPPEQLELALKASKLNKPVAVLLIHGRPLALPEVAETMPAILTMWHPGSMGGRAAADLLFGKVNPAGKLPVTFPRATGQVPIYYNAKTSGRPAQEGVERYTLDYVDESLEPLFPFGHGLSYTQFSYRDLQVDSTAFPLKVRVTVSNTGDDYGEEVVQLYVRDEVRSVTPPKRELKGFRRLGLAPGASQTVEFSLSRQALSFVGPELVWTFEPGAFAVFVGGSSKAQLTETFRL